MHGLLYACAWSIVRLCTVYCMPMHCLLYACAWSIVHLCTVYCMPVHGLLYACAWSIVCLCTVSCHLGEKDSRKTPEVLLIVTRYMHTTYLVYTVHKHSIIIKNNGMSHEQVHISRYTDDTLSHKTCTDTQTRVYRWYT